jgi:hypothetical protein
MKLTITLLISMMILVGCQDKVTQQATTVNKSSREHTQTAYPGKPTAPVQIEYQLDKAIQLGVPLMITLDITPTVAARQLTLSYATRGALTAGDAQTRFDLGSAAAGTHLQQTITVTPQAEGRHRVIVTVTIASTGGHSGSRSMSIPIVLGNVPPGDLKPQGVNMDSDAQGKPIIVSPAQEEVIKH